MSFKASSLQTGIVCCVAGNKLRKIYEENVGDFQILHIDSYAALAVLELTI